jgi:chromate transporter
LLIPTDNPLQQSSRQSPVITFWQALGVWTRVALNSFGGPAGQIAVMHRILVEEKRWISEERFLHALNYCMLLPGPEAQQLATYIGWLFHRVRGGLLAGGLFILPGFLAILALSIVYTTYQEATLVQTIFWGLKPAILAIVLEAVFRIGHRVLKNRVMMTLAFLGFFSIFFLNLPFPWIVLSAGIIGLVGGRLYEPLFYVIKPRSVDPSIPEVAYLTDQMPLATRPSSVYAIKTAVVWLVIWLAPLIALTLWLGRDHVFVQEGWFFSKAAVVTFGGAYSVLAYIAQEAVATFAWLEPGEMLDGLGMAETTPGPLIQVVQFVGYMGAFRHAVGMDPMVAGILGSVLVTWVTFTPSFLWIFLGAPYIEFLRGKKALSTALSAITATVVGVVLNLAVWFWLHTLFSVVNETRWHGLRLFVPDWSTLDPALLGISIIACLATFRFKLGMFWTILLSISLGIAAQWLLPG